MNPMKRIVAACAVAVFCVHAEGTWLLSKLETPSADAAETDAIYGYQTFANESSQVTVNVAGEAINLIASKIASDGTEGYTANVGLLLPLTPDWREHDLTGLTSITFEYQNDATITGVLSVSFGSSAYSEEIANAGTVYSNDITGNTALAAGTAWKEGEVLIGDFMPPSWWHDIPNDFPSRDTVLKHVKNLQFAPKTAYSEGGTQNGSACEACVTPTMTSVTFKLKNIVLHGVSIDPKWPNPPATGCLEEGAKFRLDDFATGSRNTLGGDWFVFSDFDSTVMDPDDSKGASVVSDSIHTEGPYLAMAAQLRKRIGGIYHKYAGWAAIGTAFGPGGILDATGVTGFGFQLADLGLNSERVQAITFKVKMRGVADSAIHRVLLPAAAVVEAQSVGKTACIRPTDLLQPSYVVAAERTPFDLSKIEQLSWEAKITDDRNSAIDTASASFLLANVFLYGVEAPPVGIRSPARTGTSVGYANGQFQLAGFAGGTRFEVRRLDGTVLATFETSRGTSISLPRGTYLLRATGAGVFTTHKFAVLDR